MGLIKFTSNYEDLSTDHGYQFKFFCDKCGNGCMTQFQTSASGAVTGILNIASNFLGGLFWEASQGAYEFQQVVGGKAHDEAFIKAVEEAKPNFCQCTRCGQWVCPENCSNKGASLCKSCAPDFEEDFAANKAQAISLVVFDHLRQKANETDYVSKTDMKGDSVSNHLQTCPTCNVQNSSSSKFCCECGTGLQSKPVCPSCCAAYAGLPKFCPECGVQLRK